MIDVVVLSLSGKHSSTKKNKALVRSPFPRNGIEIYLERMKKLTSFNNILYFSVLRLVILSFIGSTGLKQTKSQKTVMFSIAMPQSQGSREMQKMECCA